MQIQIEMTDDELRQAESHHKISKDRKEISLKQNKEILTLDDFSQLKLPEISFEEEDPDEVLAK